MSVGSSSGRWSAATPGAGQYSLGALPGPGGFRIPQKLQIVKPIEGSQPVVCQQIVVSNVGWTDTIYIS